MNVLQRLRERFWFVPALLCLAAFVLAETLIVIDEAIGDLVIPGWVGAFVYRVGESGSRDILGAVAGSSLAVAGTTFSITMAVLALTSSTYGPRLVRNFMADRGNQVVLGVYVATFLYSLLVLRAVRVIGDPGDQDAEVFVPHLAVNGAVVLAVADVAVLIYFIHHISDSIQVATLARGVRTDLLGTVDRLYPEQIGRGGPGTRASTRGRAQPPDTGLPDRLTDVGMPVTAGHPGYLQFVRDEALMSAAVEHDVLVALQVTPGEYLLDDTVVAYVHPPGRASTDLAAAVREALHVSDARSPFQDVGFAVQQLTEMAVRALSPGTNDPYTATNALDDLSVGLARLASREVPSPARFDDEGVLRVHAPVIDPTGLVVGVLDSVRWYAASAPGVMHSALELVERVGRRARSDELREQLAAQLEPLQHAFASAGHHPHDVAGFHRHAARVRAELDR